MREVAEVFYHSHPPGCEWPSEVDQLWAMSYPRAWCIVPEGGAPFWFGDALTPMPLLGRGFRYGVHDCYSLIRDAGVQFGVAMQEHPRHWGWWADGGRMYDDLFPEEGFRELPQDTAPQEGDVFLFAIHAPVSNHAGIYMGEGQMYHHPAASTPYDPTMLSRADSLGRYMMTKLPRRHLRHESLD